MNKYEFDAVIQKVSEIDGAYVIVPYNIRELFHKGRLKVHATFDKIDYDGSIVNMGLKHPDGSIAYIIGLTKAIRNTIQKQVGDMVHVSFQERM